MGVQKRYRDPDRGVGGGTAQGTTDVEWEGPNRQPQGISNIRFWQ